MSSPNSSRRLTGGFVVLLLPFAFLCASSASAGTFGLVHSFTGGADGGVVYGNLISDSAGNLYGTTVWGGSTKCQNGCGVVFELSPASGGGWSETVLYSFPGGSDGFSPVSGLVFDTHGNLFGTTSAGGSGGLGTVFELSPSAGGWSKTTIFSFPNSGLGGGYPQGLVFDDSGNLFGTAYENGAHNCGAIFELSPSASGWTEQVVHAFSCGNDGAGPNGALIFDSAGNLYGTASGGGALRQGVVFELTPQAGGGWHETLLHVFTGGHDGGVPKAGLAFDVNGNLYGTTFYGGNTTNTVCTLVGPGCGVVFRLRLTSQGWREGVIHTFAGGNDGSMPNAGVVLDPLGTIYGAASYGGNQSLCPFHIGCGTTFKLTPGASGGYAINVLHRFTNGADGASPTAAPLVDGSGNLFSTTSAGANSACTPTGGCGTVFEITGVAP